MSNKSGKLFGVLNIVDILLILILVIAIAGGIWYLNASDGKSKKVTVYFTIEIKEVEEDYVSKIIVGYDVKESVKGYYLGKVYNISQKPSTAFVYDNDSNSYIEQEVPKKVDVLVTIVGNGTENDEEILSEGQVVKMGKGMYLKGKGFALEGYIVELTTEKQ